MAPLTLLAIGLLIAVSGSAHQARGSAAPDPRTLASVSGQVTSASSSDPLDGLRIALADLNGSIVYQTTTNPDGRFEFAGIRAGQYDVTIPREGFMYPLGPIRLRAGESITRAFRKGVEMSGAVTDERGAPVAGISVCALKRQSLTGPPRYEPRMWTLTDARGRFVLGPGVQAEPGVYVAAVMPAGCEVRVRDIPDRLAAYPPHYAPGTHAIANAEELALDAKASPRVTFRLKPGPTTRVEGRLIGYANTTVIPGQVIIEPPEGPVSFVRTAPITSDGRFAIPGLTRGAYRLRVPPKRGPDPLKWADEQVTIIGEPVRRLVIAMHPTVAVGGEISFAGHLSLLYGTRVFLTVNLERVGDRPGAGDLWPATWASVLPDGRFGVTGLAPGQYRLSVSGAQPWGWHTKSALYMGAPGDGTRLAPVDLFDVPITIEAGRSVFGLTIEMTYRSTTTTGRVEDADGRPAAGAPVVVFSADHRYWAAGSRRYRLVFADRGGAFSIAGLPEGDYLAAAWPTPSPGPDAEALEAIRPRAVAFSLSDGGTKELVLRLPAR